MSALERSLRRAVAGEVAFDAATRALYTMDASNYRRVPTAVVMPRDVGDVMAAVAACREHGVPMVPRGAGTSIAGNATGTGVVIDASRHLTKIVSIDPDSRTAVVQPGVILDDLQAAVAPYGLRFGPDPSTHARCTMGGMIGNNSCGSRSVAWGTTADNVESLDVLLSDGTRLTAGADDGTDPVRSLVDANLGLIRERFFALPRRVSGYSLDRLLPEQGRHLGRALTGTEGTCVTVLGATVRLVEKPAATVLLVLGFPDDIAAADAVPAILEHSPLTVEGMNEGIADLARRKARGATGPGLPEGGAWLFVEFGGTSENEAMQRAMDLASGPHQIVTGPDQRALWRMREDGAGLATRLPDGAEAWPGFEDAAVPPKRLGAYLREFHALLARHGLRGLPYGHFGEGCIHVRIDFDPAGDAPGFRRFIEEGSDLVVAYGGSLSGEHGDGLAHSELLGKMYGPEAISLFDDFKAIFDPDHLMNPGVIVDPARIDENLRFAALPAGPRTRLEFAYESDGGDFAKAARRCVGVGKCRDAAGGVMCPSYRATRDDKHSTRGRSRLLYEMLSGELITDGWRSPEVAEALDLCLSCKGCASDCPVSVDMATYKAEFLSHHFKGRLRPVSHYSMGWLPLWLHLAPAALRAARRPGLAGLAKRLGGIAPERELLSPASETLREWYRRLPRPAVREPSYAVLWPDTFTNFFAPSAGRAAVSVLEDAGHVVVLPPGRVCCGLTWVTTGQLGIARRVLRHSLDVLEPALDRGLPVVGLEPSCTAMLKSDLPRLLPDDPRAHRLAGLTRTFAGMLGDWTPPAVGRDAIVQVHCHQHAELGFGADQALMARAGIEADVLDSGCCGLAGNFGFERDHYDVSKACAERVLLPAVRQAPEDTLLIADGFSCRTQISQETGRRAVHLAEALAAPPD